MFFSVRFLVNDKSVFHFFGVFLLFLLLAFGSMTAELLLDRLDLDFASRLNEWIIEHNANLYF